MLMRQNTIPKQKVEDAFNQHAREGKCLLRLHLPRFFWCLQSVEEYAMQILTDLIAQVFNCHIAVNPRPVFGLYRHTDAIECQTQVPLSSTPPVSSSELEVLQDFQVCPLLFRLRYALTSFKRN
jgi:hypothetical protein